MKYHLTIEVEAVNDPITWDEEDICDTINCTGCRIISTQQVSDDQEEE